MLISTAYAQSGGGGMLGGIEPLLPLVLIFVVFYFLLIRPQQKKAKAHRELLGNLRRGDRVVTNGGLVGKITRVPNDLELIVEIAEGVKVRIMRGMISELMSKPQPVREKAKDREEEEDEAEDEAEDDQDGEDGDIYDEEEDELDEETGSKEGRG